MANRDKPIVLASAGVDLRSFRSRARGREGELQRQSDAVVNENVVINEEERPCGRSSMRRRRSRRRGRGREGRGPRPLLC